MSDQEKIEQVALAHAQENKAFVRDIAEESFKAGVVWRDPSLKVQNLLHLLTLLKPLVITFESQAGSTKPNMSDLIEAALEEWSE